VAPQINPRSVDELFQLSEVDWRSVPVHTLVDFASEVRSTRADKHRVAVRILDAAGDRELTRSQKSDHDAAIEEFDECTRRLGHLEIAIIEGLQATLCM
jgi:hypothetical protein